MISPGDRALHAARNNADLYEAMFAAHGLDYRRDPVLWRALAAPLPYYAAALVLCPGDAADVSAALALALAPFAGGASVKDGFATLDLRPLGLEVGFRARWIWAEDPGNGRQAPWDIITSEDDLATWEDGWKAGGSATPARMFPAECLSSGKMQFCGRRSGTGFDAGCIVNRSGAVVGLSNVFGPEQDQSLFSAALAMAACVGTGRPVAGYEQGAALDAAMAAGFADAGPLIVWFPRSGE